MRAFDDVLLSTHPYYRKKGTFCATGQPALFMLRDQSPAQWQGRLQARPAGRTHIPKWVGGWPSVRGQRPLVSASRCACKQVRTS